MTGYGDQPDAIEGLASSKNRKASGGAGPSIPGGEREASGTSAARRRRPGSHPRQDSRSTAVRGSYPEHAVVEQAGCSS